MRNAKSVKNRNNTQYSVIAPPTKHCRQLSMFNWWSNTYNKSLNSAVKKHNPHSLISLHKHPTSLSLSGFDLSSNRTLKGVVACHNGDVYVYKTGKKPFSANSFDNTVDKYKKIEYTEHKAYILAMEQFEKDYSIEWEMR